MRPGGQPAPAPTRCALCGNAIEPARSVCRAAARTFVDLLILLLGFYYWYRLGWCFFAFLSGFCVVSFLNGLVEVLVRDLHRMRLEEMGEEGEMIICTRCLMLQELGP